MADKVISATLQVNTGTANQDVKEVNKNLGEITITLNQTNATAEKTTDHFSNLRSSLGGLSAPLNAVDNGVKTVQSSLKALAANPIILVVTLLVAALVALYKAFASTEAGAEKIEQIFSGLGAIVTVIRDRILALAGAVVDFFKGDFKKAIDETKQAVSGVGDAMVEAYGKAANATRELQEAQDDLNRNINVNRAKLDRDLAKSKELITDETASYADRKKAVNDVRDAQEKQAADELANAEKTLKALQDKLDLDKEDADARDAVAAQQARLYNIEQQQAADLRNINKQDHQIDMQQKAEADAAAKISSEAKQKQLAEEARLTKELSDRQAQANKDYIAFINEGIKFRQGQSEDRKKQDDQDQKDRDDYLKQQTDAEYNAALKGIKIQKDAAAAEKKIDEEKAKAKESILQTTSNLLGAFANLLGKQTAAGKALAIAQATIDTYQSAIASYKSLAGIPVVGPALGFAAAAAAIVNGLATVKQIVSVKVPGAGDVGGGSLTNPLSASPSAPIAPTQQGTAIDQSSIAGIGNAAIGRSYVLSQDVTHDQDRNERLNRAARLGN